MFSSNNKSGRSFYGKFIKKDLGKFPRQKTVIVLYPLVIVAVEQCHENLKRLGRTNRLT